VQSVGVGGDEAGALPLEVVGDHRRPAGSERGRLAARCGADVEHPLARSRADEIGHPLRGEVLHVAVGALGDRRSLVHPRQGGERVGVTELVAQAGDDPVGVAQAGGVVGPVDRRGGDASEHGVDEPARAGRGELDGGADRRVRGHPGERQLVRAEVQERAQLLRRRLEHEAIDEEGAGAAHARRAVDEVGGEAAVALVEPAVAQQGRQHQVGVGALVLDP
jgi:hypothetical protein